MQQPLVRGLLIVMLLVGIFLELVKPGALIGGTLALVGLVGLIVPPMLIGMAGWWEVAAIGSGIVLLLIEVLLLPGFGLFGALGALGIIAGLFGLLMPNDAGLRELSGQGSGATAAVLIMVVSLAVTVGIIYFILRNFATLPIFSRFVLQSEPSGIGGVREQSSTEHAQANPAVPVGTTGRARTSLRPFGFIDIRDADGVRQTIEARSRAGYTDAGEGVRVVSYDGRVPVVDQLTGGETKATLPDEHQPPAPSQDGPPGEPAGPQQDPLPQSGRAGDAPGEPGTNDPEPGAPKRDA
jgi:membrane-bound serine protease (ClpP class)